MQTPYDAEFACKVANTPGREAKRALLWEYAAAGGFVFMLYDNHRDEWAMSTNTRYYQKAS